MDALSGARAVPIAFADAQRIWNDALLAAGCPERLDAETIALRDAVGRIPAATVRTKHPCPTYRAAAMDGFAVRSADIATASATSPRRLRIDLDAVAIDTGGAMPDGFDAVLPLERATQDRDDVIVREPVDSTKNVRLPGEDVPPGVVIGWPGYALRPLDCAALVASGLTTIDVVKRPRLTVIPTGDELTPPGTPPKPGRIVDSNSAMIADEARAAGADASIAPICRDDGSIERALREAVSVSDIVIVIAGSSRGRRDRGADAIAAAGTIDVRGVATRPGRPVVLAHAGTVAIVDLPGYPVACHFAFHAYVVPLIRRLGGAAEPQALRARLSEGVDADAAMDEWRTATLLTAPGSPRSVVVPQGELGGALFRLASADARFHLKRGIGAFGRHANVEWTSLRDRDAASRALFVGPYDPLIEEISSLGGFRCRFTADERGGALDDGIADAVGVIVREGGFEALRSLAGTGRKVLPVGMRCEGTAHGVSTSDGALDPSDAADPWACVAAVAAGVVGSARCTRFVAERFGTRFQEGPPALYAIVWEERAGRRFPWGIVLAAAISALEGAEPKLGWKSIGTRARGEA